MLARGVADQGELQTDLGSATLKSEIHNSMTMHHVSEQVAALRRGDYDAAFLMNSPANQKRRVSAEKFEAVGRVSDCSLFHKHLATTMTEKCMV